MPHGSTQRRPELEACRAVVTGSSSGIGRAIALELAACGSDVLVHTRAHPSAAEEVAQAVRSLGRESSMLVCDLSDPALQDQFVSDAWERMLGVEIWVNNAGADVLTGDARELTFEEKLERLWRVDVAATMRLSRMAGQRMRAASAGSMKPVIINVGWDQAETGMEGDSGQMFAAVKSAVMAFSRSLAKTLAPDVRVNCVAPGWIKTSWGGEASGYWQSRATRESLLGRWGSPEDVACAVRYLASPAAAFVNGQVIHVNGGFRSSCE